MNPVIQSQPGPADPLRWTGERSRSGPSREPRASPLARASRQRGGRSVAGVTDPSGAGGEPVGNPFAAFGADVMRRRRTLKWTRYGHEVLPLWVAEMDADPAPGIVDAVQRALRDGDTGYPSGTAMHEAFAGFAAARWNWSVDPGSVVEVADVMTGLSVALGLVTGPGDPVIITPPVYPPFAMEVQHTGRAVVPAPLGADGRLDFSTLEEAFDRSTYRGGRAALLLCSPQNPTGVVHTAAELGRVAALADRYRVRVVVDEVHAPLSYAGSGFVPYLSVPGAETAFAVSSAAKAWNIAGLKAAVLVPGSAARDEALGLPETVRYASGGMGQIAHAAAFADGGDWLDTHLRGLAQNRALVGALVERALPQVGYRAPAATYFAWLDCRSAGLLPDAGTAFLEQGRVALNPGETFGAGGDGFVRLNFAAAPSTLAEAVDRMAATLAVDADPAAADGPEDGQR